MISRNEFLYHQSKLQRLENSLFEFECTNPVFLAWRKWDAMSHAQKQEVVRKWEQYYKQVYESEAYKDFVEGQEALALRHVARVKELAQKAKERNEKGVFLQKPTSVDPSSFDKLLQPYRVAKANVGAIKAIVEEYSAVYGRRSGNLDEL